MDELKFEICDEHGTTIETNIESQEKALELIECYSKENPNSKFEIFIKE